MNQQQLASSLGLAGFVMVVIAQPVRADVVKVTAIELNPTAQGIEIVLKTIDNKQGQVFISSFGKTFVANVINTQLQLPGSKTFRGENPTEGIAAVTVNSVGANSIRIVVTGKTELPRGQVRQSDRSFVLSLTAPATTTATQPKPQPKPQPEPPTTEVQPEEDEETAQTPEPDAATEAQGEEPLEIVRSAYPNLQLSLIELPHKPEETYVVSMTSKDDKSIDVYVHPYTGKILGSGEWGRTLMTFIYNIHITLLAGEVGDFVVGICGILLLLLGITGLILWTGWRRLATGFRIRWKSPTRLVNYDIHKVSGIVTSALLILVAFTGAAMIFYEQFESAVYAIAATPKPEEPKSTIVANRPRLAIDAIIQQANTSLPEGEITYITIPEKPDEAFMVAKKLPQEVTRYGRSAVYLDSYSGAVLRVDDSTKLPLATKIVNAMFPLHIGAYGGVWMRILYISIGIAPVVLAVTGFVMWWSKTYGAKDSTVES